MNATLRIGRLTLNLGSVTHAVYLNDIGLYLRYLSYQSAFK